MRPSLALKAMARESRGSRGRLVFFILCLAVGVAAVVAVAGLSAALEQGVRGEARRLLAADLVVEERAELPEELDRLLADRPEVRSATVRELVTVVAAPLRPDGSPGPSQLVELKAVDGDYPFYGDLELAPARPLAELLADDAVVVAPDLLARLGLAPGDELSIGGLPLRVAGTVLREPDRIAISLALGPRVLLSDAALRRTGLVRPGSRVEHRRLLALPAGTPATALRGLADDIRELLEPLGSYRVETYAEGQPAMRRGIRRVERFVGLVALLSLLVGGVGVAQTVRAWLAGRAQSIAVLRCLGLKARDVAVIYLGQAALLGLAGSLLGALAGLATMALAPRLAAGLLASWPAVDLWQPAALGRGLGLGLGVAVAFALPPLVAIGRVPPARVLRRDAEPLPPAHGAVALAATAVAAAVFGAATVQGGSWRLGALFTAGVALAAGLLTLGAWLAVLAVRRLPRGLPKVWLRYGLASLARPGAATVGAIVALGLGVLVVLAMSLVETQLASQLRRELPADSPSAFLVGIPPSEWTAVRALLEREGSLEIESVPVVNGRLAAVDGVPVAALAEAAGSDRERRWALTREQRLTYLERLGDDNRIVAGELWRDPERLEVSVEEDFASDLGVGLGSILELDVQGVPIELAVTSLREVDWETFGINFFLVAEPAALAGAPQQILAAARLPAGDEQRFQDLLAAAHPSVTLLRIREVLEKISTVLDRLGAGVRFVGAFTVVAGIVILAGAVSAGSVRHTREVALFKTLGATGRGVAGIFATHYALVGLVAGGIGVAGGSLLAWAVLTYGMELGWELRPLHLLAALGGTVALTVGAGVGAGWRALRGRPLAILRRG